jgi:hypothetical protein
VEQLASALTHGQEADPADYEHAAMVALTEGKPAHAAALSNLAISSRLDDIQGELQEAYVQRHEHAIRRGFADE